MNQEELEKHLQAMEAALSEIMNTLNKQMYWQKKLLTTVENILTWLKRIAGRV